ncbi:MAG: sulfotransferase [Planctomycetota bacterium]
MTDLAYILAASHSGSTLLATLLAMLLATHRQVCTMGECRSMARAARQWRRSNEEALQVLATLPAERWIDLRYEALCADPEGHRRLLLRFLALDPDEALPVEQFHRAAGHVIGNGMRLDTDTTITADRRWRSVLTGEHLAVFDRVAGRLHRRLGYGGDEA